MECRDSLGTFNQTMFSVWSCSLCLIYLFPNKEFRFNHNKLNPALTDNFVDVYSPSLQDERSLTHICSSLGVHDCRRWKECCTSADRCCQRQQLSPRVTSHTTGKVMCPRTWDGWSCFDDTRPGLRVNKACPAFMLYGSLTGHVVKECTVNGTWALHPKNHKEWTDYSRCVNIKGVTGVVYASVLSSTISLILLIPATAVFLMFKQLRHQHRIQLHVCLFLSFILSAMCALLWSLLVYNDRLNNPWTQTFMVQREGYCKAIYILLRYARCTNFFWMFCEGLFLHRLLAQAFKCPRHIKPYFVVGWGVPVLPVSLYSAMRWLTSNDICWVRNAGALEWIVYTPNLLCLLMNLVFLLAILRILLTQLHQHPNEPNHYRRALKATFVLVPLFGIQMVLVIYRPSGPDIQNVYEVASKLVIDSQGGIIALVFCYFNGEVLSCLKDAAQKLRNNHTAKGPSFNTSYSVVTHKGHVITKLKQDYHDPSGEYIPMHTNHERDDSV